MDDASLSEHEQRILEEIERNLVEEDPALVRRVREATPRRDSLRLLRVSVLGLVVGLGLLVSFFWNLGLGIIGFFVMFAALVGIGASLRNLSGPGPSTFVKDAWKRAEARIRERRSKP